jgi:cardiolipin synthase
MKRMPVDRPAGTSRGRMRGALGRVGRWTVVTIVLGFALIGFLPVTRGTVDVRILTAGARTEVNIVRDAGRASYSTLLEAGVRIFEWQPSTLHAKRFVADGQWSTIGSMNFDNRSMALNDESTLMILDPTVGRQMDQIFRDDLRHAQEITMTTFQQRSSWSRLTERLANLMTRLL